MQYISNNLRILLIITFFPCIMFGVAGSEKSDLIEQTLKTIEDCMERSPAPWPEEWEDEYLDTIRREIVLHRYVTHFDLRLQILKKGFGPYWESFEKNAERSFFELHCTRTRWYIEHLIGSEFPTDQERQKLRDQYKDLWNDAADSLLEQFPFIDPNAVMRAEVEDLSECYRKIETPLIPVYLKPISEEQVQQIKQSWAKMRHERVDLFSRLNSGSKMHLKEDIETSSNIESDYQLTKESLSQLLGLVWMIVPQRPDYYLNAIDNQNKALKLRFQLNSQARINHQRLEKERSRQLLQTEHISFMLAALLETPRCFDGSVSISTQDLISSDKQEKPAKGGDIYAIENGLPEK